MKGRNKTMEGNTWIAIGVLALAFSAFAIPYGFYIKDNNKKTPTSRGGDGGSVNIKGATSVGIAVGGQGGSAGKS